MQRRLGKVGLSIISRHKRMIKKTLLNKNSPPCFLKGKERKGKTKQAEDKKD